MKVITLAGVAAILAACGGETSKGASARSGNLEVLHAVAWTAPGDVKGATIGFEIRNRGDQLDSLVSVTSTSGAATLHFEMPGGGMQPVTAVPIAPRVASRFGRGPHVMLSGMKAQPKTGDRVPITLRFASGTAIDLDVPVKRYGDALTVLGG